MPWLNIIIVVFLLFMAYWWATQGLFSSLLHLVAVITAGALALALWEPLAGLVMGVRALAPYAWCVCLLLPFVLWLLVIRLSLDKLVPANMNFPLPVNWALGGLLGFCSAVLTAGLTVIGLGFLPLGLDLAGYAPMRVETDGTVTRATGSDLWVGVDRMSSRFFTGLSGGAFYCGRPLALYLPNLDEQAVMFRLRYDMGTSVVAVPGTVRIDAAYALPTPIKSVSDSVIKALIETVPAGEEPPVHPQVGGNKLWVFETTWSGSPRGTFDPDDTLRVPPTQVRLVAKSGNEVHVEAPRGYTYVEKEQRTFKSFHDATTQAAGTTTSGTVLVWVFLMRDDWEPQFLMVRRTRLEMPAEVKADPIAVANAIGMTEGAVRDVRAAALGMGLPVAAPGTGSGTGAGPGAGPKPGAGGATPVGPAPGEGNVAPPVGAVAGTMAEKIALYDMLPFSFSKNMVDSGKFEGSAIKELRATAEQIDERITGDLLVDKVYSPKHLAVVRVEIKPDKAKEALGASLATAASTQAVMLVDDSAEKYYPIGYVWLQAPKNAQDIHITPEQTIQKASEIPITKMRPDDRLYLYYRVPRGVRIIRFQAGAKTYQDLRLDVPKS